MDYQDLIFESAKRYDPNLQLKPQQIDSLVAFLKKEDVIVNLPTGFGKSLVYHLIPLLTSASVLVISPLNIIHKDQLITLKQHNIKSCSLGQNCEVIDLDITG